jgi:hypothetical protein
MNIPFIAPNLLHLHSKVEVHLNVRTWYSMITSEKWIARKWRSASSQKIVQHRIRRTDVFISHTVSRWPLCIRKY